MDNNTFMYFALSMVVLSELALTAVAIVSLWVVVRVVDPIKKLNEKLKNV